MLSLVAANSLNKEESEIAARDGGFFFFLIFKVLSVSNRTLQPGCTYWLSICKEQIEIFDFIISMDKRWWGYSKYCKNEKIVF